MKALGAVFLAMSGTGAWIEDEPYGALAQWGLACALVLWFWAGLSRKKESRRQL